MIDVVGIFNRQFAVLNGLIQFGNGVRVLMAFMRHVIAKASIIVNGATWDHWNSVVFFFFGIRLPGIYFHGSTFLDRRDPGAYNGNEGHANYEQWLRHTLTLLVCYGSDSRLVPCFTSDFLDKTQKSFNQISQINYKTSGTKMSMQPVLTQDSLFYQDSPKLDKMRPGGLQYQWLSRANIKN